MLINVKKFLLYGIKEEIDRFFKAAQNAGFIEFIGKDKIVLETAKTKDLLSAIKILKRQSVEKEAKNPALPTLITSRVLQNNQSLESLYEEKRMLEQEISRVRVFGNFSIEDIEFIEKKGNKHIQFFCVRTAKAKKQPPPKELIYIGNEYDLDYYMSIEDKVVSYPKMIEMKIDKPLGLLESRFEIVVQQIKKYEKELKDLAAFLPFLQKTLQEAYSHSFLSHAKEAIEFPTNKPLFVIEAWVPENRIDNLYKVMEKMSIHAEEVQIEKTDRVPTCFENKGISRIGEDLVKIYDVPAATDKDPSTWVFFSFALFFAIIIADAGYGFLYLLLALALTYKFKNKMTRGLKRVVKLVYVLACTSIVWGVLTASFFGIQIGPNNPMRKSSMIHCLAKKKAEYHLRVKDDVYQEWQTKFPSISNTTDGHEFFLQTSEIKDGKAAYEALDEFYDNILMEISLLIGIIHILCGLGRYARRNYSNFGWMIFMVGGYLFFPSVLSATSMVNFLGIIKKSTAVPIGEYLLYSGMGIAVIIALIKDKLYGLLEIANVIQLFGDTLSYLRLYALALASMILAYTFNGLGESVPPIFGIFIIIAGHSTNIVLGLMGGIIHGLRLNFLEWYHYCYEGEGKLFNPLRKF